MNLLSKTFFASLFLLIVPAAAQAACSSSVPYTFTANSPLSYVTTNGNNNYLVTCTSYASHIVPTNTSQATFGGTQSYTFPASLLVSGGVTTSGFVNNAASTLNGNTAVTGIITSTGNISWGNGTTGGTLYGATGNINHTGNLVTGGTITATGGGSFGGNLGVGQLTSSGSVIGTSINGTGLSISGGGSIGSALTTAGISNTGSISSTGSLAGGSASITGDVSSATFTGKIGATPSQILPVVSLGSPITGQANAHIELVSIPNNGTNTYSFAKAFDAAPICVASYTAPGAGPTPLGIAAISTTQYQVTTPTSLNVLGICIGP